jgi:hypothetical protein
MTAQVLVRDYCSSPGAASDLARIIREFWFKRGGLIETSIIGASGIGRPEPKRLTNGDQPSMYLVRSDMLGGLPQKWEPR